FQDHGFFPKFHRIGVENDIDFALADGLLDALGVALFDAAEGFFAVRQNDLIADLVTETHGRFDGTVAAADDQDFLVHVVVRLNQAVHYLGKVFPFNAKLARAAALAQREHHVSRAELALGRVDGKDAILAFLDIFAFVQRDVFELFLDGAERGTDACRTRANNYHIMDVRRRGHSAARSQPIGNRIDTLAALIDSIFDQGQSAEFPDDEQILDTGLVFGRQIRDVGAHAGTGHDHGDGAHRTNFGAQAMTDAFVSINDDGFAAEHGEHITFRTNHGASRAADAVVGVNVRMLRLWSFRE